MPCRRRKSVRVAAILGLSLVTLVVGPARAAAPDNKVPSAATTSDKAGNEWHQWRGPQFNGASTAANIPDKFDDKTNVRWTTAMPGPGSGTPIVVGDRVFVSALDKTSKKLLAMCVGRADGKILWSKEVGEGFQENQRNNFAAPSPLADDKTVWFHFGSGDLVAFDFEGNQKWARNIAKDFGAFNYQWIYGSSPALYDGRLYVQVLHRDEPVGRNRDAGAAKGPAASYLLAIDPATGKDLWKHDRDNDAVKESKESYGTPVPLEVGGKKMVMVIGGDCVTAHDAATGAEIWRCGGWNPQKVASWRIVPTVVVAGGLVIACPPKGGAILAIKPDGAGDVSKTHVAWGNTPDTKELTSDVCVPLFYQDKLFVLNGDKKILYRADPATGKIEAKVSLGGTDVFRGSPTAADGKIFCMNEGGQVWVVSTTPDGDKLKVLNETDLGGGSQLASRSSVALADGQVFIRTGETLYCIGTK